MILGNWMEFFSCRHLMLRGTCPDQFVIFSSHAMDGVILILIDVVAEADLFAKRRKSAFTLSKRVISVVIRGFRIMSHFSC